MDNLSENNLCASHLAKTNWCIASCPRQGQAHVKFLDILGTLTTFEDEDYDHDNGIEMF